MKKAFLLIAFLLLVIILYSCHQNQTGPIDGDTAINVSFMINGRQETIILDEPRSIEILDVPLVGRENAIGLYSDESCSKEYDGSIIKRDTPLYVKCNYFDDYNRMTRIDLLGYVRVRIISKDDGTYVKCLSVGGHNNIPSSGTFELYNVVILEAYTQDCEGNLLKDNVKTGNMMKMGISTNLSAQFDGVSEFVVKSKYCSRESELNWGEYYLEEKDHNDVIISLDIFVNSIFTIFPVINNKVYFYDTIDPDKPYYNFWDDFYYIYPVLENGMSTVDLSKWFEIVFYKQDRFIRGQGN